MGGKWNGPIALAVVLGFSTNAIGQSAAVQQHDFTCQHRDVEDVVRLLRPLIPESSGAEIHVDQLRNRFRVMGPASVVSTADRLVQEVDIPSRNRETAPQSLASYRLPGEHAPTFEATLRQKCPGARWSVDRESGVAFVNATATQHAVIRQLVNQLAPGSDGSRISSGQDTIAQGSTGSDYSGPNPFSVPVRIDENTQSEAIGGQAELVPAPSIPQSVDTSDRTNNGSRPYITTDSLVRFVAIPHERLDHLQQQIQAIFNTRLQLRTVGSRQVYLLDSDGSVGRVEIEFDKVRNGLLIGGSTEGVAAMVKLATLLTRDKRDSGYRAQAFHLHRKNHSQLLELIDKSSSLPIPAGRISQLYPSKQNRLVHRFPGSPNSQRTIAAVDARSGDSKAPESVRWVRHLFHDADGEPTAGSSTSGADRLEQGVPGSVRQAMAMQPSDETKVAAPVGQFEGVEIESLPELDVIILRGSNEDLDQLTEVIEQLERISRETRAEIRVRPLQHAQSEAVAQTIQEIREDLIRGRQGRASVIPLVKPNAVLVIGWGDAVTAIEQLIDELDKAVSPDSQSQLFRLRYATAQAVSQTLQQFFQNRTGLGPRLQTAVDARTNSLIVYAAPRDLMEVAQLILELDRPQGETVNRARVFPIANALAADVATTLQQAIRAAEGNGGPIAALELQTFDPNGQRILRSGTLQNVQITPNVHNNTVIVTSPQENLELIAELIRQLDTPVGQVKIKVFRIVNGDAAALIDTLRSLIPSQQAGSSSSQLASSLGEPGLAPLRFSVDIRSNSIISTGSEGDLAIVEALLAKLDQTTTLQRQTAVYRLKNSPAVDVATAVNQYLFNRRVLDNAAPGGDNPFQEIEREVVVVPEPVANKLILAATPRYFKEISQLIEKLDEQPPQVLIQVLIAEVALNNADEFGVELGLQDSVLFDRSLLGDLVTTTDTTQASTADGVVTTTNQLIQAATNIPGFAFNSTQPLGNSGSSNALTSADRVGGQGISNFGVGRSNDQLGFGGLVLSASSKNVSVLLRALRESRRVDVLSRPQIRTLDNQPAFIQVGQRVPRIVGSTVNQNGQSNSVALENVGLILGVTPRISPDGTVVMEIDAEKSALGPEIDGIPVAVSVDGTVIRSPRVDTTTAQATVSAADGETIVLGGLITENDQYVHRSVPFLGDIPILEHFFRFDSKISRKSELLIILTPHVIRTPQDNERIRQAEMARMSWCACDVYRLMDDIDYFPTSHLDNIDGDAPDVIYPDLDPTGSSTLVSPPVPGLEPLMRIDGPMNVHSE